MSLSIRYLSLCIGITASFLACAQPSRADITYKPEERYFVPGAEDNQGSDNVEIREIEASVLPEALATKLRDTLKECAEGTPSVEKLKLYAYTSETTRKKRRLPNILVDFTALSTAKMKPCYQPYVLCQDKACQLLGYVNTGDETSWNLGFSIPVLSWNVERKAIYGKAGPHRAYFKIASETPDCEEYQGKILDGVCLQYYEWRGMNLSLAHP